MIYSARQQDSDPLLSWCSQLSGGARSPARCTVALSGGTPSLQGQQPPLCQKRSPVHGWGLYAAGPIAANVFVIEYIGELLRRPLDDVREKVGFRV